MSQCAPPMIGPDGVVTLIPDRNITAGWRVAVSGIILWTVTY